MRKGVVVNKEIAIENTCDGCGLTTMLIAPLPDEIQMELAKYKQAVDVLSTALDIVANHKSNPHKSYMVEICDLRRTARDASDEAKTILSGEQP